MKKIFLLTFLSVGVSLLSISFSYGETTKVPAQYEGDITAQAQQKTADADKAAAANAAAKKTGNTQGGKNSSASKTPGMNVVMVTEKVPGAKCEPDPKKTGMYRCETARGFGAVLQVMATMLKYFTFLCGLFSVLALVVGGIMYSMGGASEEMKNNAKDYITKSLMGLIVLLLSGSIMYAVAPWVFEIA